MPKKIFKVGNYGPKGTYTREKLESWKGKEFSITAGHVEDWKNNGYPITSIPVAGSCKVTGVDGSGFLLGEFSYNNFGEDIKDKYPNLSIGLDASGPNHIALLGYAPPHIKDLSKSFSEFSKDLSTLQEEGINIEFSEKENNGQELIDELVEKLKTLNISENINLSALQEVMYEKQDSLYMIKKLKENGYTVEKTTEFSKEILGTIAETLGMELNPKKVETLTSKEIYAKAKAEFTRDAERDTLKKIITDKVPPVLKSLMEFAVDKAFEENEYSKVIEFSETEKVPMAEKLKEFSKQDGPFAHLFKNVSENIEFSEEENPTQEAINLMKKLGGI